MHLLLLGYSSIAQRRIIPALESIEEVDKIDVACRRKNFDIRIAKAGNVYHDYAQALKKSQADVVYVSLVNGLHYRWVEAALDSGFHVIVDKPAFLASHEASSMVSLAKRNNRALVEATVFTYHPQTEIIKSLLAENGTEPLRLTTLFSFPPMTNNNFRYDKTLGGGALFDLGPYAIAAAKLVFGKEPQGVVARINARRGEVDISFSVLMSFSGGGSMIGHFGFDTQYQNRMSILSENIYIEIERVFTLPAETENSLKVYKGGDVSTIKVPPSDMFSAFFQKVFSSLRANKFNHYSLELLKNALAHERIIQSAGSSHD